MIDWDKILPKKFIHTEDVETCQGYNQAVGDCISALQDAEADGEIGRVMSMIELLQLLGLIYTYPAHSHKTLDSNLMKDIATAIHNAQRGIK